MMIKVQKLNKFYGSFRALSDVSFEVKTGEIMGFLGPNGAGKTTTMKILAGYMPPSSGTAWINDLNIEEQSLSVRQNVGYLPEANPLYTDFTVEETLRYISEVRQIDKDAVAQAIDKVVRQCGLAGVYYKPIEQLSKGFRQRVGLAQALIHEPSILILDEPTVGLDPKQIIEIRELIKNIGASRTVLLSTHILQEVHAICDKVTIISGGRIVASDTPEGLQQKSEEQVLGSLYVKMAGTIREVESALKTVKGVTSVTKKDQEKKNINGYTVQIEKGADIRNDIFRLAKEKDLQLFELTPEKASLEDVFLELTK
ncbi:hypothetical protein AUK40_00170 [Candidatus Wirthbacteria bacterium CG2_30_54_11]|uniref:ABC transporter domain-containing protein n=1 Tax=Candidatus Wirthbacteria bacterium CG2_30_54_11 TaxID=1817892 RepID=A0A1J5JAB8_9BACT|nr:MAG: hypothetical protein AUK40_00170 [Candidatus Wirthbacteria bacterium CG2_30_54_11]